MEWLEKSGDRIERARRLHPPEVMALVGGVAVLLGVVLDVDLPFFEFSEMAPGLSPTAGK